MIADTSDPPTGSRTEETVFHVKSQWQAMRPLATFGLLIVGVALVIGLDRWSIQARAGIARADAQGVAVVVGGIGLIFMLVGPYAALRETRWLAVSADGIRWQAGWTVHERGWDQYVGIQRTSNETRVNGEGLSPALFANIQFQSGNSLRVGKDTVDGYEELLALVQTRHESWLAGRLSGSWSATKQPARPHFTALVKRESYGPLRLDAEGVEWDGVHRRWNEVAGYEVAHGYLRITTTDGTEFLRRVEHLGAWELALARMDEVIGSRRVGEGAPPTE